MLPATLNLKLTYPDHFFIMELESKIGAFKLRLATPHDLQAIRGSPRLAGGLDLARRVYRLTALAPFRRNRGLRDQLERAAVSVSNNVAEGFKRGTTQELLTFLYIARGSAGEVRSMLCLLETLDEFAALKSQI
jgi:four helix bundle protein